MTRSSVTPTRAERVYRGLVVAERKRDIMAGRLNSRRRGTDMFGQLGVPELLLILAVVLLLFGVGRVSKIGRELGTGIREFRQGLSGDDEKEEESEAE
jgi:sec-independent protein translocase protein TatA